MNAMPNYRIAVVGCGYVGGALARALVTRGHDVVATTTTPERVNELAALGVSPVVVEVDQVSRLRDALAPCETVFLTVAAGRRHGDYRSVYVDGVRNLLRAVSNTTVRRIIYTSSTSVYAQDDGSWVDEDSPTEPTSETGRVLLEAEEALSADARDAQICATILRLSGIWGPGRSPTDWALRSAGTERSDGDAYLNLIHRDDIVQAMTALLETERAGVLNLSNDQPVVRREFYDQLMAAIGADPIRWVESTGSARRGKRVRNRRIKDLLKLDLLHPGMDAAFGDDETG